MMSHLRRCKILTYSLGFRCLNSTLIMHSYLSSSSDATAWHRPVSLMPLQRREGLLRVFQVCKSILIGKPDRRFQFTTRLFLVALFFQSHAEMVVISRTRRAIRRPRLGFIKRYCFAQLLH